MARIIKDIVSLYDFLKEKFEDRLEIIELDENDRFIGTLDKKIFIIKYIPKKSLVISCKPESREILDEIKPLLIKALGGNKTYCIYDYQKKGLKIEESEPTIDWNLANTNCEFMKMISIDRKKGEEIHNIEYYTRGLKQSPSILGNPLAEWRKLPARQCLSEETLILLERRIAKAVRENEEKFTVSSYQLEHMMPCMSDGEENKGKSYTKKK